VPQLTPMTNTITGTAAAPAPARSTVRRRRGFTLTELAVSLVMFGIVSAIILGMVRSQQRFYRGATEVIDVRSQLRQAAALLPLELRSVSTVSTTAPLGSPYQPSLLGSDIVALTDRQIRFRATIGSGVVCARSSDVLTLVPRGVLARGNMLTSWYSDPAVKDTVFIFDPGDLSGAADDQWRPYEIAQITSPAPQGACTGAGAGFVTAGTGATGDADKFNFQFKIIPLAGATSIPATIGVGSIVRLTRTVAYGLYRSTADNKWYLGYKAVPTGGGTISAGDADFEPVSGPYNAAPTAGGATNGLAFTYYDSTGAVTTARDRIARVDIVLRGSGKEAGNAASNEALKTGTAFRDSLLLRVAVRNRS
jgi:prepilin-type N-terminal cleavage/methylation domain-containing protein